MISCYAYRVAHTEPDMLAVAFRLNTGPQTLLAEPASAPLVEAAAAAAVAKKVEVRFWDIDQAMDSDEKTREAAISGTRKLLLASNYDVDAWQTWVDRHARQGLRAR
ncbi:hypothetical protein SAMN04488568_10780 [Maricaulis salignorans]|uniref:Uncharacterized protein n=2 Tax=Maricaulis salignorans TaxID=144026 RepID=A0A1G9RMA7_9PROT|nr:hypothetical protein SAMN04488568_10780 [Maricaulis salignorans]